MKRTKKGAELSAEPAELAPSAIDPLDPLATQESPVPVVEPAPSPELQEARAELVGLLVAAAQPTATDAPAHRPLTDEEALQVRGLWHDGRQVAAIKLYQSITGAGDEAPGLVETLAEMGPPPADYRLPEMEAPPQRSLEDSVIPAGEGGPRPPITYVPEGVSGRDAAPAREPAPKQTGVRQLGTKEITLEVELTREERLDRAVALAQLEVTIPALEAEQKIAKAAMKAAMGELEAQRHALALAVREGKEARTFTVREEIDHDAGVIRRWHGETLLSEAPIDGDHRQVTIGDKIAAIAPAAVGEGGGRFGNIEPDEGRPDEDGEDGGEEPEEGGDPEAEQEPEE